MPTKKQSQLSSLVIYRALFQNKLIKRVRDLILQLNKKNDNIPKLQATYYAICSDLIKIGEREQFKGDLWKNYLIRLIATDKNIFSLTCEKNSKRIGKSLYQAAKHDLKILQKLYDFNLTNIGNLLEIKDLSFINNFLPSPTDDIIHTQHKEDFTKLYQIFQSQPTPEKLINSLIEYYNNIGAGQLGLYSGFRWIKDKGLIGINNPDPIKLSDLVGYQSQKEELINNTEAFLAGKKANNIILYGASGTGKSSSIKALLNKYRKNGLRLIEVAKYQMKELPKILSLLKDRGLYFIIFMDDLSFEDFETDYKYMKAIIEGGLEIKPDNVLFYATSNRRHLIKENWSDRDEENSEIHISDAIQEKLSLVERFGISISYESPDQKEYLKIVKKLAEKEKINLPYEELKERAIRWELWHNGRSGRTAQQFINYLIGQISDQ